jgi:hypothetical protein
MYKKSLLPVEVCARLLSRHGEACSIKGRPEK